MEFVVYCDESRHDSSPQNQFMGIGGLWVPRSRKEDLSREFRLLREACGLKGEVKWSKVSAHKLEAYKKLADFFFSQEDLRFRIIIVDQPKVKIATFHGGDRELGFYKFYYEMLEKWIFPGNRYLVLLDFKKNKGADRYSSLRRYLELKTKGRAWIDDLTVIDSYQSHLAQLCDVLTGVVAATWCRSTQGAKAELASYIGQKRGASLLASNSSPDLTKFNIFKIRLD
jgi:hypothetical protein